MKTKWRLLIGAATAFAQVPHPTNGGAVGRPGSRSGSESRWDEKPDPQKMRHPAMRSEVMAETAMPQSEVPHLSGGIVLILIVAATIWSCGNDRLVDIKLNDKMPPAAITDLKIDCVTSNSVELTWTAPGDDGIAGRATSYDIRHYTYPIDSATWKLATVCPADIAPSEAGIAESYVVAGLDPDTPYYFAIRAVDEASNRGGLSNTAQAETCMEDIVTWAREYGGPDQEGGLGNVHITLASDGGCVLGGETSSYGNSSSSFYFLKVDEYGNQVWHSWYGYSPLLNVPYGFAATLDGGFIMAGDEGDVNDFDSDILVVKVDGSGNLVWEKTYGNGGYHCWDFGSAIATVPGGGYVVGGETESVEPADGCLLRIDESGEIIWWQTYPYAGTPFCVYVTADGGFLSAGLAWSGGALCGGLIRTDESGNLLWSTVVGSSLDCQILYSVVPARDGGYIIAGYTHEPFKGYLAKINESGGVIWEKTCGGSANDMAYSICRAHCGGYVVAGATLVSGSGDGSVWIFKIDESGNLLWERAYAGSGAQFAMSIAATPDGGYVVAGKSYGNGEQFCILKVDDEGRLHE